MKTTKTLPAAALDVFFVGHEIAARLPNIAKLMRNFRTAECDMTEWATGPDPELARSRFLAQATDLAELERLMTAWERMEAMRRSLPLVL